MRTSATSFVIAVFSLGLAAEAHAQTAAGAGPTSSPGALLPDASFVAAFRKYTPPDNVFSPFAAWDAELGFAVTAVRHRANEVDFAATFQTIGIESPGSKVSVAGIGYIVRLAYLHTYSDDLTISAGVVHLSSHLTRDLDQRIDRARREGTPIPVVQDPSEYNVPFLRVARRFPTARFRPDVEVILQPVNVRVGTGELDDVRPLYLAFGLSLWRTDQVAIALETQHEIGRRPLNNFTLVFDLHGPTRTDGRLQLFVNVSPGDGVHVSPNLGGLRDGLGFGVRMKFRAA